MKEVDQELMLLPSVKVVQESMLISPQFLAGTETRGSRQGSGRRVAGSLSTLLLHSGLQSGLCYSCVTAALQSPDMVLTARAEARGGSMEGNVDAVGFIKKGSFHLYTSLSLVQSTCFSISVIQWVQSGGKKWPGD